jgi:DNA-binding SARP family transcriptional activator/Tfp pilus assembly protein PilF
MQLEVKLLGRPEARLGDTILELGAKPLALLCLIAAHPQGLARQRAWELLWGDDGAQNLRQALLQLRRLPDANQWLTDDETLRVHGVIDLVQLEEAASVGNHAAVLELYRGAPFEGFRVKAMPEFQDWLGAQQVRVEQILLEALRGRAQELRESNPLEALQLTERWLALDPHGEEALRIALYLEIQTGQRDAALRRVQSFRRSMREELGVDVTIETLEIVGLNETNRVAVPTWALRLAQGRTVAPDAPGDAAFWSEVLEADAFEIAAAIAELEVKTPVDLSVTPGLRTLLHRRVALTLQTRVTPESNSDDLKCVALHWQRAEELNTAIEFWLRSSGAAGRTGMLEVAGVALFRALWLCGDDMARRDALIRLSLLADARNDVPLLNAIANELLRLGTQLQDDITLFHGHLRRASVGVRSGQASTAVTDASNALGIAERLQDDDLIAQAHGILGTAYLASGQLEPARTSLETAANLTQDATLRMRANANLGSIAGMTGRLSDAMSHFEACLTVSRSIQNFAVTCSILFNLGATAEKLGQLERAESGFREAVEIAARIGNSALVTQGTLALAKVHAARGAFGLAFNTATEAFELCRESAPALEVQALYSLGELEMRFGRFEIAREFLHAALEAYRTAGNARGALGVEVTLACLELQITGFEEPAVAALRALRDAGHVDQYDNQRLEFARLSRNPARIRAALEGLPEARTTVHAARLAQLEGRNFDEAMLEAALNENPEAPLGHMLLAQQLEQRGETGAAREARTRARQALETQSEGLPKAQREAWLNVNPEQI